MNTQLSTASTVDQIHADHDSQQRLGSWTVARAFEVRARRSSVVIDLRSPQIPDGDIEIDLAVDHSTIKLLVAEDTVVDQWDLTWTGRGKVKQTFHHNPAGSAAGSAWPGTSATARYGCRAAGSPSCRR